MGVNIIHTLAQHHRCRYSVKMADLLRHGRHRWRRQHLGVVGEVDFEPVVGKEPASVEEGIKVAVPGIVKLGLSSADSSFFCALAC